MSHLSSLSKQNQPKYHEFNKEWWTIGRLYKTSVGERSCTKLRQSQRFWVKPDAFVVSDIDGTPGPVDPLK